MANASDSNQYYGEMSGAVRAQEQVIAEASAAEARLSAGLQARQTEALGTQAQSLMGLYSGLYGQTQQAQRQAMMGDIQTLGLGSQYATQAYQASLPAYARNLQGQMAGIATSELGMGMGLSPQETRFAQQSARAAAAARGLTGNQAVGLEVLSGYNLGQQRQKERRGYAMDVYGMGQQAQAQGYQMFLSPSFQTSSMFSLPGLLSAAESGYSGLGPQFLTPESQYLANIRANRMQMESANYAAKQAKKGSIIGGALQAAGSIGGAAILMCWVARCVYGEDNPRWLVFREWVLNKAPGWFRELYISKGEAFAGYISDKPILKAIVRKAMDVVVDAEVAETQSLA